MLYLLVSLRFISGICNFPKTPPSSFFLSPYLPLLLLLHLCGWFRKLIFPRWSLNSCGVYSVITSDVLTFYLILWWLVCKLLERRQLMQYFPALLWHLSWVLCPGPQEVSVDAIHLLSRLFFARVPYPAFLAPFLSREHGKGCQERLKFSWCLQPIFFWLFEVYDPRKEIKSLWHRVL